MEGKKNLLQNFGLFRTDKKTQQQKKTCFIQTEGTSGKFTVLSKKGSGSTKKGNLILGHTLLN